MDSTYDYSESMGAYTARLLNEAIKSAKRRSRTSPRQSPGLPQEYSQDSSQGLEIERDRAEQKQHAHDDEEQTAAHFAASRRRPSTPLKSMESFDESEGSVASDSRRNSTAPTMTTLSSRKASTVDDETGSLPRTPPEPISDIHHFHPSYKGSNPPANTPIHLDGLAPDHLDDYYTESEDASSYDGDNPYNHNHNHNSNSNEHEENSEPPEAAYIADDAYSVSAVEDKLESLTLNQSHDDMKPGPLRSGRDLVDEHTSNVEAFKAKELKRLRGHLDLERRSWSVG